MKKKKMSYQKRYALYKKMDLLRDKLTNYEFHKLKIEMVITRLKMDLHRIENEFTI